MELEKKINWEILSLTRFLLAFIVLVGHLEAYVNVGILKFYHDLGSFEAILGFLLISGLSIGKSISRNKDSYFKRRLQRIYPVYAASLFCALFFLPHENDISFWLFFILNLLFLNHVITSSSFVGPSWTLAVEVWLYALAPILTRLKFKSLMLIVYVSFICYCFYTCGRTLYHWNYYAGTQYGINLVILAFIWVAGFALAHYPSKKQFLKINIALIFLVHLALTIGIQLLFRYKHQQLGLVISEDFPGFFGKPLCLAFVFYVILYNHKISAFSSGVQHIFHTLGNISYPLYLIHSPLFRYLSTYKINSPWIFIAAALLLSFIIYYIFDFYSKKRLS